MEDGDLNSMFELTLIAIANEYYEDANEIVHFIIEKDSQGETEGGETEGRRRLCSQ